MKETSFKAGVIGGLCGVFTFLALFATTSKASINESAATNGDYKINRVQYEFINELTIYKVLVFQVLSMCIKSMSEHCLIKKNTPELRKKLEDAGLSVCICTTFEDADWLSCWGSDRNYSHLYICIFRMLRRQTAISCMLA